MYCGTVVKHKNSGRIKEDILAGFIVFLFVLGFFVLSNYTGYAVGEFDIQNEISKIYTPSTSTICREVDGRKVCNLVLYSGAMFAQNKSEDWVEASNVLKITKYQDDITFWYTGSKGEFNITFESGVFYNSNYYSFQEVKSLYPEIKFNFPNKKDSTSIKYSINITDIPLDKSLIQNITLTYKDHYGFTINQLKSEAGRYTVKGIMELLFNDLIDSGFTVNIVKSEKRIYISNITLDKFNSDSLYLDPTIHLKTADTENLNDDDGFNAETQNFVYVFGAGYAEYQPTGIMWNISMIPSGQQIDDARLFWLQYVNPSAVAGSYCWEYTNRTWYDQEITPEDMSLVGSLLDTSTLACEGCWINFSVTSWVSSEYDDGYENVSFVFNHSGTGTELITWYTKETTEPGGAATYRPTINITYSSAAVGAPVISLWNPTNNSNPATSYINFTFNVSDASDISMCQLYLDTTSTMATINETDISITKDINQTINVSKIQYGDWYWMVECNDSENDYGNSSINKFTIDAPAISLWNPTNNSRLTTSDINFTFNVSDTSSIDSCRLYLGTTSTLNTINETDISITKDINQTINLTVQDGNFYWKVNCNNSLNHYSNSSINYLTVDTIGPVIDLQVPENNTRTIDDRSIDFIFNATDDTSDITNCSLLLNIDGGGYQVNETIKGDWNNQSDAVNLVTEIACTSPNAITTNGTDFWISCTNHATTDRYIYHLNASYDNQSDYMDPSVAKTGNIWLFGLTTNGSDFWFINEDAANSFVFHLNASGDNITDGFNTETLCGADFPTGLTTNGTDFWFVDLNDDFIYHTNYSGYNYTDGFSISAVGSGSPFGLTTNGTDFWFMDFTDDFIYHVNMSGYNFSDGIKVDALSGAYNPTGLTTPEFIMAEGGGGAPDEFWFLDDNDDVMYHIKRFIEGENYTIPVDFAFEQHDINWKVQCYDDLDIPRNSSEMYFELDALVTQSEPNIGAHAFVDENYVVGSWRFEHVAGTNVVDETGLHNGTVSGARWCPSYGDSQKWNCSGRIGKGFLFDGDNDDIDIAGNQYPRLESDIDFTFSAWIKNRESSATGSIADVLSGTGEGFQILFQADDTIRVRLDGDSDNQLFDTTSAIDRTGMVWTHITLTVDRDGDVKWYLNGGEDNSASTTNVGNMTPAGTTTLNIGSDQSGTASSSFNGTIDEVTIWNRSLSAEEVLQLWNSSAEAYSTAYTIQDISASNNLTQDEDNDTIKFIYDWYVNNESMAVLNMPFEAVNNGSEMNFSKDYSDNENHGSTSFNSDVLECTGGANGDCSGWNRTGGYDGFGAYHFDGDGDWIEIPDDDSLSFGDGAGNDIPFSVSAWIKMNDATHFRFISKLDLGASTGQLEWALHTGGTDNLIARIYDSDDDKLGRYYNTALTAYEGKWTHVAMTYDASKTNAGIKLYLNAQRVDDTNDGTGADYDGTHNSAAPLTIGRVSTIYANGSIDEVLIFNRSLSVEQIKALYYNQTQTIKSAETVKGQSWKAEVTTNDGYGDSIEYNTSEIIIEDITLTVHSIWPENLSIVQDQNPINFTYNVTGLAGGVENCSLWMALDNNALSNNMTDTTIDGTGVNQSFSVTFETNTTHQVKWKVGCWDEDGDQTNSSEGVFTIQRNELVTQSPPNIGAHAWYDRNYVVGSWRFEEFNTTTFLDETGLNNGTISGGVKWCPDTGDSQKWNCSGRIGKGVMFDGDGDYIDAGDPADGSLDLTGDLTLSAWVKVKGDITGAGNHQTVIGKEMATTKQFAFEVDGDDGKVAVYTYDVADNYILSTGTTTLGKWNHIAFTYDGTTKTIYINGVADISETTSGYMEDSTDSLKIGYSQAHAAAANYFNGTIDEVTIWNRSLSATEVAQLYYSSADSYNSTFTIQDISASNNNTQDEDNDTIKFIYDWYVNNESMAVLNMPFEAVNNGSEMNFSKDYSDNESHGSTSFNSDVLECTGGANGDCSGWNRTGGYDGFGAYHFDGAGDVINLPYINASNSVTYAMWTKQSVSGSKNLFSLMSTLIRVGTTLVYWFPDTSYASINVGNTFNLNQWYYIVVTQDSSNNYNIYVNGVSKGSGSTEKSVDTVSISNKIGAYTTTANFNGTIDEVLIFNRSLSAEQVKALYLNQTQTIKSQETVKGQSWKAEVTANDGYGDSIEYNTSEIIIDDVSLIVENQAPINYYNSSSAYVNFTFNVSDAGSIAGIQNCSLWLYKSGSWELNKTDHTTDGTEINQSINITIEDSSINWTIACYDKDLDQTNSSNYNLTIESVAPVVNIYEPDDEAIDTDGIVSHIYNMSDNVAISNCTLYTNTSSTAYTVKDTDTSITKEINQSINVTYTSSETINWKIGCYNIYGLQGNSSSRELTIQIPVTAEEEEAVAGGSSPGEEGVSGPRKSSTITETRQTISGNVYSLDYMVPGVTGLSITDPILSIYKIELDVNRELENINIEIKEGKTTFVNKPEGRVYRYITINKNNLPDSAVNKIIIYFKVQKNFGENINLMHYDIDWKALETEKISEDEYYEYYKGESNGLSLFAITAIDFKKSFVRFFKPGLIQEGTVIEEGFFTRFRKYFGVSIFSFVGLFCMVLLFMVVRSKLKRKRVAKAKPKRKRKKTKKKVKRKTKRKRKSRKIKKKRVKKR